MNGMTAQVELEQENNLEQQSAMSLSEEQLVLVSGGQCTTNSI